MDYSEFTEIIHKHSKLIVLTSIIVYTIIFSTVTILRYYSFQTYAYDLGIYNQALHTPLHNGQLFYNTADLLANPTGNLFGIHFSPILFVILPFYLLYSAPPALLVIQTFALALGALPLYLLASYKLKSEKWALTLALLYLINPALQGVNWYDFHPEAFLPVLLLFSVYFFEIKRTKLYVSSVILTLCCLEFAAPLLVFMAFYFIIALKPWRRRQIDYWKLKLAIITILLSLVWFFASVQVIHAINPFVQPMSGETYWGEIGAKSLLDVPGQIVTNPERVIQALSFDVTTKSLYFLVLLGSVAFLPVLEPLIVICLLPWVTICYVSNYQPFYLFGDQYPAYVIPFLFYGAVLGLAKLTSTKNSVIKKKLQVVIGVFLCLSIAIFFICTPLNSKPLQSYGSLAYGYPEITEHDRNVLNLLSYVPADASIMAQNDIFPHLSNRPNIYVFPAGVFYPPGESLGDVLEDMLAKVDFIIGDLKTEDRVLPILLHYVSLSGSFGVYAASDGAVILKRGYSDQPVFFQPEEATFTYNSLTLVDGSIIEDSDSESGYAFLHSTANVSGDLFWVGPYVFMPPGEYEATFRLKIDNASEGNLLDLYVSYFVYKAAITYVGSNVTGHSLRIGIATDGEQRIQASLRVKGHDFTQSGVYQDFSLKFNITDFGAYEFRGVSLSNSTNIYFSQVGVLQSKPLGVLYLDILENYPEGNS